MSQQLVFPAEALLTNLALVLFDLLMHRDHVTIKLVSAQKCFVAIGTNVVFDSGMCHLVVL